MRAKRRFRLADARAICTSDLAQIGQFRHPQLRAAIACRRQRWQREEQPAPALAGGASRCRGDITLPGRRVGGRHLWAGWDDRGA